MKSVYCAVRTRSLNKAFCIYLRTNSDLCHLHHKLIGFYNRDEKCLLRGTNWVSKSDRYSFVLEGLIERELSSQIFYSYSDTEFHENPSSETQVVPCVRRDGRKDRHGEAMCRFSQILRTLLILLYSSYRFRVTCMADKASLINPLNAELNPIRHLLALAGAHHFVHVSRVRSNLYG